MSVRFVGASVVGRLTNDTGGSVLMVDRTRRRRRRPDWSVWMLGWQSSFFHVVVGGMSEKLMVGQADSGEWGVDGVQ